MKTHGLLSFMVFLLLSFTLRAGEFLLNVNDVSGLDSPWPMIASIPFAEGELKDASAIRITSGGREVPSQVDVAATWRDGSIRWVLAGFTASPQGKYRVEYGERVKRGAYPNPLKIIRQADGGFTIDTGAAVYQFDSDKLLPENGWLVSGNRRIQILKGSGAGVYLVDNSGRTARVAGQAAGVENNFIKEGPGRVVLKRSGWYVTGTGEKLAKADVWFYFAAGTPCVRVTHSIVFTEDTNKVWFKDYGLEFKTPGKPADVYCTVGENNDEIRKVANIGEEVFLLQSEYPHFMEREYKAAIGSLSKGQDKVIEELKTAGDWAHGDYGNYGITLVMPWLAERYPKELSFGERGARAVLWSGRSGKELDFHIAAMVKDYWQNWTPGYPDVPENVLARPSNAQGGARTHDIWFLPHTGGYEEDVVKKTAMAGSRQVLVLADPVWLCETQAMGYPMLHKDTEKFPREETLISDYWQRIILPLRAFPMTGYIAWGCYPSRSYHEAKGKPLAAMNTLESLRDYGFRREPWRLYARSGERGYYNYGHRFSRFTGDWYLAHWDAPQKKKGGFIDSKSYSGTYPSLPVFWGDYTNQFSINAGDIGHWLLDYYLVGDERSLDLVYQIKKSFADGKWKVGGHPALIMRTLLTLSLLDHDENAIEATKKVVHSYIDMESQNALKDVGYGPMYKDHRSSHNLLEYYLETGDELAKQAFLKLIDQRYRFDRRYRPTGHKNYDAFTHSIAYMMTGDERFRRVVEQTVSDALYYTQTYPLSEDLKQKPENPLDWPNLYVTPKFPGPRSEIYLGQHEFHNPFIGLPTALKLFSEKGRTGMRTPVVIKSLGLNSSEILFSHLQDRDTKLSLFFSTLRSDVKPTVYRYSTTTSKKDIPGITIEIQKRIQWPERLVLRPDDFYHMYITIPSTLPSGLYLLSLEGQEPFTLLDITTDKAALYCPEGFWCAHGSPIRRQGEGDFGRAGEGIPMYFRVPDDLKELELFIGRAARVKRQDGSTALEMTAENIGNIKIPVDGKGGIWSIQPYFHGYDGTTPPSFFKLINVEPIVAFGTPDFLPEGTTGKPVKNPAVLPPAVDTLEFVPGIAGQAVRLSGGHTLRFARGQSIQTGGYVYFPETTGTVEFWFCPDRTTWEIPIQMTQAIVQTFVRSPFLHLCHLYEVRSSYTALDSNMRLELYSDKQGTKPFAGFQGQHFFKAGEWNHISFTWDIKQTDEKMAGELNIFVNGKKLKSVRAYSELSPLGRSPVVKLQDKGEDIIIGPFEGSIDVLRLSDTVRYKEDFIPSKTPPIMDKNTRALFLFDGDLKGISAFSNEPIEAQ